MLRLQCVAQSYDWGMLGSTSAVARLKARRGYEGYEWRPVSRAAMRAQGPRLLRPTFRCCLPCRRSPKASTRRLTRRSRTRSTGAFAVPNERALGEPRHIRCPSRHPPVSRFGTHSSGPSHVHVDGKASTLHEWLLVRSWGAAVWEFGVMPA
jgi:hypothetical protein